MDVKVTDASILLSVANGAASLAVLSIMATDSETLGLLVTAMRQAFVGFTLGMTLGAVGAFFKFGWQQQHLYTLCTAGSFISFLIAPYFALSGG